ncbi:MAG: iron dependent repressor, metal binding and dimerization domain protein, partial [Bacteroidota bacterium]
ADPETIRTELDLSRRGWNRRLAVLRNKGLVTKGELRLTDSGKLLALRLVRAHRLWETFLNQEMGLTPDQIHEEAERLEHLLTPAQVDLVDAELGYPETDPHGSLIPVKPE